MQNSPSILKSNQKFSISITKNKDLLHQFYSLRNCCYKNEKNSTSLAYWSNSDNSTSDNSDLNEKNSSDFIVNESNFDRAGQIVLARINNDSKVIGGARLMFENEKINFANETPDSQYLYRKYLEEYKNETVPKNSIVEISSMVILREYRNGITFKNIVTYLLDFIAKNKEAQYVVCIAPLASCRLYKITAKKFGYKAYIDMENQWVNENHSYPVESYLIYMKLRN